jgi:O-acetylserine/cysteine efflux transporter
LNAPSQTGLRLPHLLLALAVVAVWGSNFVVIKAALEDLPPLLLAALRYAFAFLPAALLVRRPPVGWRRLAAYGVLIGVGQFGLLFIAMRDQISPGLASLVIQTQVFFTIGLAVWLNGERPRRHHVLGLPLAAAGLALIAWRTDGSATGLGLALVLLAALSWAAGNLVAQRGPRVDMLAFVVWSSGFAVVPLLALSWLFEGHEAMAGGLAAAGPVTWAAVLWQSVGNTLFGYAAWGWLLARYAASEVSPLALGVPVLGMTTSAIVLGESLPAWKLAAAALVMAGLAVSVLGPRLKRAGAANAVSARSTAGASPPAPRTHPARPTQPASQAQSPSHTGDPP